MTEYVSLTDLMNRLQEYYHEHGIEKTLEYTFGFFDAVRVLQDLASGRH